MKALRVERPGALALCDVAAPEPRAGEVLVRVEAAALNFADLLLRDGRYLDPIEPPFTAGRELAGTIVGVGPGVAGWMPGARVVAIVRQGAFAELAVAPAASLFSLPRGLSAEQGAALLVAGLTALVCLEDVARVAPGETVLVQSAAGGVGSYAVQVARALGARVAGTASSPAKLDVIRELGAELAVDYAAEDFVAAVGAWTGGRGVDVVLETIGGDVFRRGFLEALAPFGRMVVLGVARGAGAALTCRELLASNKTVAGFYLNGWMGHPERLAAAGARLAALVEAGAVRPLVGERFPLARGAEAFERLRSRRSVGKLVLVP
ncbi:MAG TPA: NADPH:quinone oxidoreductase family protein [Candidatus Binatia bacterium]|nr:NADPH:quinone oxidoreductase family protein [Candidatus Binatia bacterium]